MTDFFIFPLIKAVAAVERANRTEDWINRGTSQRITNTGKWLQKLHPLHIQNKERGSERNIHPMASALAGEAGAVQCNTFLPQNIPITNPKTPRKPQSES